MSEAHWPYLSLLIGVVLMGFFVGLGYLLRFKMGSVVGSLLVCLPVVPLLATAGGDMGMILVFGVLFVAPMIIGMIVLLAWAGSLLREKQTKTAMIIIGVVATAWISGLVMSGVGATALS